MRILSDLPRLAITYQQFGENPPCAILYRESDTKCVHEDGIPFASCYVSFDPLNSCLQWELVFLLQNLQIEN